MGKVGSSEFDLVGPTVAIKEDGVVKTYQLIEEPREWAATHSVELQSGLVYKPRKNSGIDPSNIVRAVEIAGNVAVGPEGSRQYYSDGIFVLSDKLTIYSREDMARLYEYVWNVKEHGVG